MPQAVILELHICCEENADNCELIIDKMIAPELKITTRPNVNKLE